MNYAKSYNEVLNTLERFSDGHYILRKFTKGDGITDADIEQFGEWPWMHVNHPSVSFADGVIDYSFTIQFADLPRDFELKTAYQAETLSDLLRIAGDLLNEIQNGQTLFGVQAEIVGSPSCELAAMETKHTLTMVTLTFTLRLPNDWSACDIPAEWAVYGGGGGGAQPYSDWCDKLIYCPLIIQILADIDDKLEVVSVDGVTITGDGTPESPLVAVGGGGGGGVQSVSGESVDNTDPANPVVNAWPLAGTGTDIVTGDIEIDDLIEFIQGQISGATRSYLRFDSSNTAELVTDKPSDFIKSEVTTGLNASRLGYDNPVVGAFGNIEFSANTASDSATYPLYFILNGKRIQTDGLAAPIITDDSSLGYQINSFWIYDGRLWICTDATAGAAVWNEVGAGGGGGITELTGDVTAGPGSGSQTATIANDAVTYAKMQNVSAASRLLGRGSAGGSGDVEELTIGTGLSLSGTTLSSPSEVSDTAYGAGWNGQTTIAPSQNAVYNKIEAMIASDWKFVSIGSDVSTTSTSPVNITGATISLEANSKYIVDVQYRIGCSGVGGLNTGFTFPSDGDINRSFIGTGTATTNVRVAASSPSTGGASMSGIAFNAANSSIGFYNERIIVNTVSAGTLQAQFQSVTGGQTSTIYANNTIIQYIKIA